ncbi:MAG: 2TM domain-containing protein, partial [Saprospiraceae bacterium]|nr:2TM domain-containing protein [Saprospiraceae bacterium]
HFTSWMIFSVFFIVMNLWTDPREFWAIYPIVSWGVAVAFHAIGVFGLPWMGSDWEERMIERELERMEHNEHLYDLSGDEDLQSISPSSKYLEAPDPEIELRKLPRRRRDSDFV